MPYTFWPHHCVMYAKWLKSDCTSYGSLVAAALLNTRSTCKLSVIKHCDCTATQLMIYGIISAVALQSSPPQSAVNAKGWNLDSGEIVGSATSVNKICILFWRMIINLKTNSKETVSEGRRSLYQTDHKSQILPNWLVVFSSQSTENTIPKTGFVTSQYA